MKKIFLCSVLLCATVGFGMKEKKDRSADWSAKNMGFEKFLKSNKDFKYSHECFKKKWIKKQAKKTWDAIRHSEYEKLKKQPTKSFFYTCKESFKDDNGNENLKYILGKKDLELKTIIMYKFLTRACELGDLSRVKELCSMFPEMNLNYCVGEIITGLGTCWYGQTLVTTAARKGCNGIITFLVSKGADPNLPSTKKYSPVYCAVSNGHLETLKLLIDTYKCDPNAPDYSGSTPLTNGVFHGHLKVVKYLLDHPKVDLCIPRLKIENKKQTIHELMCIAARRGRLEMLKYLMDRYNYDVNNIMGDYNDTSKSILWIATMWNEPEICKYLLKKGANVHLADDYGNTLLHHAARDGKLKTVKLFISHGIKPDVKNKNDALPLHYACGWGRMEVVKYLVDVCKCNPFAKDDDGKNPFDYARKPEIIKYFNSLVKEKV